MQMYAEEIIIVGVLYVDADVWCGCCKTAEQFQKRIRSDSRGSPDPERLRNACWDLCVFGYQAGSSPTPVDLFGLEL